MITEIVLKKYLYQGQLDKITVIVRYESGRSFWRTYHSVSEIPYKFRDFLTQAVPEEEKEITPEGSPTSILMTTYRRVDHENMRDMQEQSSWMY